MVSSDKVDSVCQSVCKSDIIYSLDLQFSLSQLVPKITDFYETTIIAKKL